MGHIQGAVESHTEEGRSNSERGIFNETENTAERESREKLTRTSIMYTTSLMSWLPKSPYEHVIEHLKAQQKLPH